jgi:hypothetical protein
VLPVLADTSMASTDVPSLLPVLLEAGRHFLVRGVDISCLGFERRQRDQSERSQGLENIYIYVRKKMCGIFG